MANDVVIEVEARVGDAIAQMTLTAAAVRALGDAGSEASATIGDESDGRTLSGRLSGLRRSLSNIGDRGPLGTVVRGFGNLASAMLAPLDIGFKFAQNFEQLGTVSQVLIGSFASLGVGLAGLAAAIGVATFAATALASILGTLTAIVADLVAPVTLLATLLGGLAAGFVIGGKRAAEGGGKLNEFSKIVDTLGSMFGKTSNILAHVFLPYFVELGHAAEQALNFLDKIIKLPLGQAFRALDQQGVPMLGKFVDRVSQVLSRPLRLAFRVAFDDTAFSNMVSDWWHRFVGFLFGATERHPVEIRPGVFKILPKTVDGVFQPFIEWWNRHHFTRQGIQIGRQILAGLLNSGMRDRTVTFFGQVFRDAGRRAFLAIITMGPRLTTWFLGVVVKMGQSLVSKIPGAARTAVAGIRSAFNSVVGFVQGIWNRIVSFIESPLHINIDWPSPPSWLTSLPGSGILGGVAGGIGGVFGHVAGVASGAAPGAPRVAMAAPNVFVTIHQADLSDAPTRRRIAHQVGKEIASDWRRRAGGH